MTELLNRLKKNSKRLKGQVKSYSLECYRLYERDLPNYSFIVDVYGNDFVVYQRFSRTHGEDEVALKSTELEQALLNLELADKNSKVFLKSREIMRGKNQYTASRHNSYEKVVKEGDASFLVNLTDHIDTGLFFDHRPLRMKIRSLAAGKSILNLFSYTCAISVYGALGGGEVDSVDLSKKYLDWGEKNFELNKIEGNHRFVAMDCLSFLKTEQKHYDLIVLDPPTFSNSKKTSTVLDIQRDHLEYIELAMARLKAGGILFFSCNRRDFKMEPIIYEKYRVKKTSDKTIPFDFRDKKIHQSFEITKESQNV